MVFWTADWVFLETLNLGFERKYLKALSGAQGFQRVLLQMSLF